LSQSSNAQGGWFWQNPLPQGNILFNVHVLGPNTAITVGAAGTVMKTTDGGESWDIQHYADGATTNLSSVHFINSNIGYAIGGNIFTGVVLKTRCEVSTHHRIG
jgi:photosystem II stability/assembly factor-like uncharacterized protein